VGISFLWLLKPDLCRAEKKVFIWVEGFAGERVKSPIAIGCYEILI